MSNLPKWAIGPFTKVTNNPVIAPTENTFDSWAAYNPAVIYKNGLYHMYYRAETNAEKGTPHYGTSRIGYATSTDGTHFAKQGLLIDADQPYELPGGLEDPRIVIAEGKYHLLYTAYKFPDVHMCRAVSDDLIHWEKKGPMFPKEFANNQESKSGCVIVNPELHAVKINGLYHMFTNELYATSPDFENWTCEPFFASKFSGRLNEVCTAITDYDKPGEDDIVLFIAGTLDKICPDYDLFYAVTECLLKRDDPRVRLDTLHEPIIKAEHDYEKSLLRLSGDAKKGTIFLDSIFKANDIWHAYYGASDMNVGAAFAKAIPTKEE